MKKIALLCCLRRLLIFSLLIIFSLKAVSSNYYWIGNSGNWTDLNHWATTSGGTTTYNQIPTAFDDVFFDANSFSLPGQVVNFNAITILAHNINWTGASNTPAWNSPVANSVRIYGSLTLAAAMTINLGGPIYFEATTTGQTIITAGNVITDQVIFDGVGGAWTLQDAFASSTIITLNAGTLITNNQTVSAGAFWSMSNTARILNMGASVFNLSGSDPWWIDNTGFTVNCGTSVINLTGVSTTFHGSTINTDTYHDINFTGTGDGIIRGKSNFHDVVFVAGGEIYNTGSFHNVTFSLDGIIGAHNIYNDLNFTAGHAYQLWQNVIQTVNGTLGANGTCAAPVTITSNEPGYSTTIIHPPGNVNCSYVVLRDINATGGANFLAGNSTDLGNNTGWTFTGAVSQNFYWIGNGGDWGDVSHWSLTSGGASSGCTPSQFDNVFFDANSFSLPAQTVLIAIPTANCRNMDWTGVTNIPTLASNPLPDFSEPNLDIFGSLKFVSAMNMNFGGTINFEATSAGQTITTAGQVFKYFIAFNGIDGEWTLQDAVSSDTSIIFNSGTLTTNNQTVTASDLTSISYNPRTLNMGSSVFNLHGAQAWLILGANLTVNSGTAVINLSNDMATFMNYTTDIYNYYDVNFTGPTSGTIFGSAHFHDVHFLNAGVINDSCRFHLATFSGDGDILRDNIYDDLHFSAGHTYHFWEDRTQTINGTFDAQGTCGSLITITSYTRDNTAYIKKLSGSINIANTVLHDINTIGAAVFTASNSVNLGNNTGWTFNGAPGSQNLYWIGNAGNWTDGNHWSFTSGGAPSGCAPTPFNNVFFDANSFSAGGQTVLIDITSIYCKSMDWTGSLYNPLFTSNLNLVYLNIYGSLKLVSPMTMYVKGDVNFEATTTGQTITLAGKRLYGAAKFNGNGGEWTFLDQFDAGVIWLNHGTLNTNNQAVNISSGMFSLPATTRVLNMGASVFNISGMSAWRIENPGITINSGTSVINCFFVDFPSQFLSNPGDTYYDVNFMHGGVINGSCNFHDVHFYGGKGTIGNSCNFHFADFHGDGVIYSDNVYDNLHFSPGAVYQLWKNRTQTVNGTFDADGSCGSLITINSGTDDSTTTITHPPGAVTISRIILKDVHATGGATFTANNSLDLGNNTGWAINTALNPDLYWIGNSGYWTDGNHWSLTSGGPPSGCTPTVLNNVFFDANSFTTTGAAVSVNILMAYCRSMNWTGAINSPAFISDDTCQLNVYGSLKFTPGMNMSFAGKVNFEAITPGQIITMDGISFISDVTFNGTGQWTLVDGFSTTTAILFNKGILNTNNQPVTANNFQSLTNNVRTLNMGASVFSFSGAGAWEIANTGLIINSGTSVINCIATDAIFRDNSTTIHTYNNVNFTGIGNNNIYGKSNFHNVNFTGNGHIYQLNTFNDVVFSKNGQIDSSNVFHDLLFTSQYSYTLGAGSTQTIINYWKIQGSCTEYIILQTNSAGFFATVNCAANSVFGYDIHLRDIHCTGAATFIAYNSVDLGGNAGWNFMALPPLSNAGTINGPTAICAGSTGIIYTVTPVQGAISYQWTVPPGATITGGQGTNTITVSFGAVVTGSITVQACGGCGCSNASISPPIVISGSPVTPTVILTAAPGNSICFGTAVNFTATATNTGIATVNYDFIINGTSVQSGSSNTYSTSTLADGDEISCAITAISGGCFTAGSVSSNLITLNVSAVLTPAVLLIASPGINICSGTSVTFTATATNTAAATIIYDFKINGTSVQNSSSDTYNTSILADGDIVTCTISLSGTTNCFTSNNALSNSLTIHSASSFTPSVIIAANPGTVVCVATAVTFTATATNIAAATVIYDFEINGTSVQNSSSDTYTTSTLANGDVVTCIIFLSGAVNCLSSTNALSNLLTINTTSSLSPSVLIAAGPGTTFCAGTAANFIATAANTGSATITYNFSVNGTSVQNNNSNIYITSALADGDVVNCTISLTGTTNCLTSTNAISNSLSIHLVPSFTPSVTISSSPGTTVCPATVVGFTATASNTGTATINYNFEINGTSVQSSSSNIYSSTVSNSDIVTCLITITGGSCFTTSTATSNSITMNVDVNAGNVNVDAGTNITISAGQTVQLNASGDAGTYLWSPSTGLSATNILSPVASPVETTTYTLTITNVFGCSASDDIIVEVKDNPDAGCIFDPRNAFTPNGDGINDKWIVWQGTCSNATHVIVLNRYGQVVFESHDYQNDWEGKYKGKTLPDGTYYFIVEYKLGNGRTVRKRGNVTILR